MKVPLRHKINYDLAELTSPNFRTRYFDAIPLSDINNILKKYGFILIQEDGTEWSGFLFNKPDGEEGNVIIEVGDLKSLYYIQGLECFKAIKETISLSWFKMPSGRYEITCYIA